MFRITGTRFSSKLPRNVFPRIWVYLESILKVFFLTVLAFQKSCQGEERLSTPLRLTFKNKFCYLETLPSKTFLLSAQILAKYCMWIWTHDAAAWWATPQLHLRTSLTYRVWPDDCSVVVSFSSSDHRPRRSRPLSPCPPTGGIILEKTPGFTMTWSFLNPGFQGEAFLPFNGDGESIDKHEK